MSVAELLVAIEQQQRKFDAGQVPDNIVLDFPRVNNAADKKTNIAHQAALQAYAAHTGSAPGPGAGDLSVVARKHAYIQYNKQVSKLQRACREEQERIKKASHVPKYKTDKYHLVRFLGNDSLWRDMVDDPPGPPVLQPVPMPVTVPPLDDFKPFLCHMRNKSARPATQVEFKRGVFYADGRIDMCKQVPGPDHIGAMMDSIKDNPEVRHFLMGNSIVGLEGACRIAAHIAQGHPIETWYLAGNNIDAEGVAVICQALAADTACKALWLKRNPLMARGVMHVADMLTQNTAIEILDLHNVGMMDEGCVYLFKKLCQNTTLKLIYMDANALTLRACTAIKEYMQFMHAHGRVGLTSIYMGMNPLKDAGIQELAKGLAEYCPHLERLCVSSCRFTSTGLVALLEPLARAPLAVLDIGHYLSTADMCEVPNCFTDPQGIQALANFVVTHQTLQILDCRNCHLSYDKLEMLADAVAQSVCIKYVYAYQYGLESHQTRGILERLHALNDVNCKAAGYKDLQEYCTTRVREVKHTPRIVHIDSIYRNNM